MTSVLHGPQRYTSGSRHSVSTGMPGSPASYPLNANAAAGSGDAAGEFITSATGWL